MKTKKRGLMTTNIVVLASLIGVASSALAQAQPGATPLPQPAHGSLWLVPLQTGPNDPAPGGNHGYAATFPVPAGNADVSFTTSIVNFESAGPYAPSYTIGGFLSSLGAVPGSGQGSPTYSGITHALIHAPVTASTPIYNEPGGTGGYAAYLEITGDVFLQTGSSILITHDDGVSLKLNGVAVSACTSATSTQCFTNFAPPYSGAAFERYQWNGPTGLTNFNLVYTEGFGGPANLKMAVVAVPEPEAYALTCGGLMIVSLMATRRKRGVVTPA